MINDNFDRWIKGSKVINKQNEPIIVYHGTINGEFYVFNTEPENKFCFGLGANMIGACFSESLEVAKSYPNNFSPGVVHREYSVYLSIKNPKKYTSYKALCDDLYEYINTNGLSTEPRERFANVKAFKQRLIEAGYDGLTYSEGPAYNNKTNKARVWVAFYPNQIKSTDNVGSFDTDNDDIRY